MAGNNTPHRIRATMQQNIALVKVLIRHPMETGRRRDTTTGKTIPRHFIRELQCELNGEPVLRADWSWGVARNPYLSLRILAARPGDRVLIRWSDNRSNSEAIETVVG